MVQDDGASEPLFIDKEPPYSGPGQLNNGTMTFWQHYTWEALSRKKDIDQVMNEVGLDEEEGGGLKKALGVWDVIAYGVGSTVGAGIFVITGQAAQAAGPAIVLSFVLASLACMFTALAYAEFAARVPVAGSAYTFTYTSMGECTAWYIGWNLTLAYCVSASVVARGWASNVFEFLVQVGANPPTWLNGIDIGGGFSLSLLAAFICVACTIVLILGVKESARFNMIITIMNVCVMLFIIILGSFHVNTDNWHLPKDGPVNHPMPLNAAAKGNCVAQGKNRDHGEGGFLPMGVNGLMLGAAQVFFSYIGFDATTTLAEEVKNPKRDLPIGIAGTLVISTSIYIGGTMVITGIQPWYELNLDTPLACAFVAIGLDWAGYIIFACTVTALTATTLCSLFGQPRIFYRMARDGLLFSMLGEVHKTRQTPVNGTLASGIPATIIALFFGVKEVSQLISMGTLLAFSTVCAGVVLLRYKSEERPRAVLLNMILFWLLSIGTCVAIRFREDMPIAVPIVLGVLTCIPVLYIAFALPVTDYPTAFACPLVPFFPCLGIFANMYLVVSLPAVSFLYMAVWTVLGFMLYFGYGIRHSALWKQSNYRFMQL